MSRIPSEPASAASSESTPFAQWSSLRFSYPDGAPILQGLNGSIFSGQRVLFVGANGVGKSTFLKILSGMHWVPNQVKLMGSCPFERPSVTDSVCTVYGELELRLDLRLREVIRNDIAFSPEQKQRDAELMGLLGVQLDWRMHQLSDGQRKRVQLFLGLRKLNTKLWLLDEVTAQLDVTMRTDLLKWLAQQVNPERIDSPALIFATHIFDGMWDVRRSLWPTQILALRALKHQDSGPQAIVWDAQDPKLLEDLVQLGSLSAWVDRWIRSNS